MTLFSAPMCYHGNFLHFKFVIHKEMSSNFDKLYIKVLSYIRGHGCQIRLGKSLKRCFIHTNRCQYKLYRLDKDIFEKFVSTKTDKCQRNIIKTVKVWGMSVRKHGGHCKFMICFDGKFAEMYEITILFTIKCQKMALYNRRKF